jgi:adenylate cyclase
MTPELTVQHGEPALDTAAFVSFTLRLTRARHDLRGCVGQILGFSEMLLEDAQEKKREHLMGELQRLQQLAAHMIGQINEGLAVQKISTHLEDLPSLQRELSEEANQITALTESLKTKCGGADGLFESDLERIAGAARQAAELSRNALSIAREPHATPVGLPAHHGASRSEWSGSFPETGPAAGPRKEGAILVVDDLEENRELLRRRLSRLGYSVQTVESGGQALQLAAEQPPDLILLDIIMPGLDGFAVLNQLKQNPDTHHIPVVMLSSSDDIDTVVRCISLGADDFLPKPFNASLLMARIESSLSKKRLRDQEAAFLKHLQAEREISERLLLNILPWPIAERLKQGEKVIADSFPEVTVLFSDFVGFTKMSAGMPAKILVEHLNEIFSEFDRLCEFHGLEKIKMIGDAYMAVSGLPTPRADGAEAAADLALDMQRQVALFATQTRQRFRMRVGLDTGPVVAGVIGTRKFAYDLWGDTVNLASRMEAHAKAGGILVTSATHGKLGPRYRFKPAGLVQVKGRGQVLGYTLLGKK